MEERQKILHELYVFSEWKPEPEYLQKPDSILPEHISALWKWISFFGPKKPLIDSVTAHKERQQKWHIALGDEGKVIAVLTDNILEIRTKRSDYATIAARTTVSRDGYPQWRKVVWSPDCSFLAVAYGTGVVSFFDLTASNLFNIPTECSRPGGLECTDNTHAVANIIFMPLNVKHNKWNWEVLIVTYDGKLRSYLVSQTEGYKLQHRFTFAGAVAAVAYSSHHSLLYVASLPEPSVKDPSSPLYAGITAWRILNDDPYYKLSVVSDEIEGQMAKRAFSIYIPFVSGKNLAFITDMVLSPKGTKLVCLHCTGEVSVWSLPLLKLVHRWPLAGQPAFDLENPLVKDDKKKDLRDFYPADVNWWSEEEIILARFNGAVSICGTEDLSNLLARPEYLQRAPRVSAAHGGALVALECESLAPQRRMREDSMEVVKAEEPDLEDTMITWSIELFKSLMYGITDMEAFQPKPRRITMVSRIYRLLALKSTTPEQLFHRKIEGGRYAEALTLADTHRLDRDLVYQQQWRKTPVSTNAIHKFLSKVSKKIWVVHQCVDRLPETLPAAKELLQFGLQLTNHEIIKEVNRDREEKITEPDVILLEELNAYSSELLRCRHVMLFYRERLQLYEDILNCEKSSYVKDEYDQLRSNSLVHSAIELAKEGRIAALACLWPHISSTGQQLTVLEKLPETINPLDYKHLLPTSSGPVAAKPQASIKRDIDWCRKEEFRSIWSSNWSEDSSPDSERPQSSLDDVTKWYERRAREMEENSGLISHALTLITLAIHGREVKGLENIMFNLLTLDTLVYDIGLEDVSLKTIEKLSTLDTCKLFIKKTTEQTMLADIKQYVLPFLKRYESVTNVQGEALAKLKDLLESMCSEDLTPALLVLSSAQEFALDVRSHIEVIERCLDAYVGCTQLDKALSLLDTLVEGRSENSDSSIPVSELAPRVKQTERVLRAAAVLWNRGVEVTLSALRRDTSDVARATQMLSRLARSVAKGDDKPSLQDWEKLLTDILELQSSLFSCVTKEQCHEIYASSLLTSGDAVSIKLTAEVLTCDENAPRNGVAHLVPYDRSVALVSNAATEYFNSAASLTDPALELAKCCLLLIKDDNPQIKEELDLIASLSLLNAFNMSILPIQVRLCTDRMQLIEDCLKQSPAAHMASHKLITLATLLKICPDDEQKREGNVLQLVCSSALSGSSPSAAAAAARRLLSLKHAPAAPVLAQAAAVLQSQTDRSTRRDFLAAAATYCEPGALADILRSRCTLELEQLEQASMAQREQTRLSEGWTSFDDEFADAMTTPTIEKKDFAPAETTDKKFPLFNYLLQTWQNKSTSNKQDTTHTDEQTKSIHCQEFYRTLYPELAVSSQYYAYNSFALSTAGVEQNRGLTTSSCFMLHHCLGTRSEPELEGQVFQNYAEEVLYKDTPLAISCLLRSSSAHPFSEDVSRDVSLIDSRTDETTVSTVLYAALIRCNKPQLKDEVYMTKPVTMAQNTLQTKDRVTKEQMSLIRACIDRLSRIADVTRLRQCGLSVQAPLFAHDEDYRKEIIFSAARSKNKEHLDIAYSLARKYKISDIEVLVENAGAAISDASLIKHIADSLPVSKHDAPLAVRLLEERIWNELEGNDHNALINFFTLLKCVDEKFVFCGLTGNEHIKLLKKVKAASQELNYKLLISQPSAADFLEHTLAIARPDSVGLLTKLMRSLPAHLKLPVTVNGFYTEWLTRYFFDITREAESTKKWMQQFRQCASYFSKLSHSDLLKLMYNTCFSKDAIQRVPSGTRVLMINQAVDYCQQEMENEIKMSRGNSESDWAATCEQLCQCAQFLEAFHSPALRDIRADCGGDDLGLWREMEQSHGDKQKLCSLVSTLVLEREASRAVLLALTKSLRLPLEQVISEMLTRVETLPEIEKLVTLVTHCHADGFQLPTSLIQSVMTRASTLGVSSHKQITLVSMSPGAEEEGCDGDRVRRIVGKHWPELDYVNRMDEESLSTDSGKRECFNQLVAVSDSWQQKKALADVLGCWAPLETQGGSRSLHCEYIAKLLDSSDKKESLALIKLLLRNLQLTQEELKWLMDHASSANVVNIIWCILLSKCESMKSEIPNFVLQHKDHFQTAEFDDELIKHLLDADLLIKLVPTPVYPHIVTYILSHDSEETSTSSTSEVVYNSDWVIKELIKANFLAEAGHIKMMTLGAPAALRGFSQSVTYFKSMFK